MSNLTKVMVTRSGTYQPLPNHLTPLAALLGDALLSKLPTLHPCCLALRIASIYAMRNIVPVIRSWPLRAPASTDPALRRRVRRGVLQGEQLHALARHVHYGKRGHADGRDFQQQMSRASCLVLILAAIIYWQILEIDSVLRHWDPAAFG